MTAPFQENNVFDPDQDPEQKRNVRQNYRNLTKQMEEHKTNPTELTTETLKTQLAEADQLFSKVRGPQEATLDSHFLLLASNAHAQKARTLKSGSGAFDVDDFITKLLGFMGASRLEEELPEDSDSEAGGARVGGDSPLDWERIGRKALARSRRVPTGGFMFGPLAIEQKKRGPVNRMKLQKDKESLKKPEELKEEDITRSQNETTKNVATLEAILETTGAINIFKFVVNPTSFAQTVENIFYLSFLIRDGKAAFEFQDGDPVIYGCEQPSDEDYQGGLKKMQMVLEFDMDTWKVRR
ncbi:Nse4 C-terminal-domain-containing protein [Panaeolus papilionaceus]|nr:Nse4 C-terminal-domain-containing protein [Panaeolus papilionaceus]